MTSLAQLFDRIGHTINLEGRAAAANLDCAFGFLREHNLIHGEAVDVGANIGNHALYFADHFTNVIALEPNPRVFELLELNAKLRKNIRPLKIGASDVTKAMSLSYDSSNSGGGQLWSQQPDASRAFTVPVRVARLDDLDEVADHLYEVRLLPGLPRTWNLPGRAMLDGLLRLVMGERKRVVPVKKFEAAFYPMVITLPS